MATVEHDQQPESRSKVKVTRNAKGDPQWEVSVVEGTTEAEVGRLREIAVRTHQQLTRDLVGAA